MKEFSEFIVAHWEALLSVCVALISLFIAMFRKRPITKDFFDQINSIFGLYGSRIILDAEKTGKVGHEKLNYAIEHLLHILKRNVKVTEDDEAFARIVFENKIESALETPRKKV